MLIDTSAWIAFKKNKEEDDVLRKFIVEHLSLKRPVFTTPLIVQEVLQGFYDDKKFEQNVHFFAAYDIYILHDQVEAAKEAANIYRTCRKAGYTIRKPNDCMIALVALTYDLPVLHKDKDFSCIAKVFPLKEVQYV